MFTRLFTPKWEHADPRVRRQALASGAAPREAVAKAAREDEDPEIRCCAVELLDDLALLVVLLATETVPDVREVAGQRLRSLLAASLQAGPPLEIRLQTLQQARAPNLSVFLVRQAQVPEIRVAALEQVQETEVLCDVAIGDAVAAVRRAALERIEDPQAWETIARQMRNKDKQLSRLAHERLEVWQQARADRENAERLCREMEGLLEGALQAGDEMHLRRLDSQWATLASVNSPQLNQRYQQARDRVAASVEQLMALHAKRRDICADLENLLANINEHDGSTARSADDVLVSLDAAMGRWQALLPAADDNDSLARRFAGRVREIRLAAQRLARDHARAASLQALLQEAGALAEEPGKLDEHRIKKLETRWAVLEQPACRPLAETLQHDFETALQRLRGYLDRQRRQRLQALDNAADLLVELEAALQEGELERALSLRDRLRHRLKTVRGVAEHKRLALQEQLQGMQPRLEELRQWRHWGGANARQRLCSEIESLTDSVLSAEEVAARVRNARAAWKRIDHAEGPAAEALWQRFDEACTRAYKPYQRERRAQAARRVAHYDQKHALCLELDAFERDTDWKQVDWQVADQKVRKARERWRRIGSVPEKAQQSLAKNYHEILERLESHLGKERERELQRRRALIRAVERLATATDLRAAIREVKAAQAAWKPTVQASRQVEQSLWKQFRSACDAVFKHAREQRSAADAEEQANLERKTALCAELEALLGNADAEFAEIAQRFARSRSEWGDIGSIPRKLERSTQARYEALVKRFQQRRQQEARAAEELLLQGMSARSRLCQRLETEVLESTMDAVAQQGLAEEAGQAWQALETLEACYEKVLRKRLDLASRALGGENQARQSLLDGLSGNLEKRLELCLQTEIATGIDSPAEFTQSRMQYQVARLAEAMQQKPTEPHSRHEQLRDLQIAWYQAGPAPLEAQASLEARFGRAISAVASSPREPD
jgi:exonuclease SbcC